MMRFQSRVFLLLRNNAALPSRLPLPRLFSVQPTLQNRVIKGTIPNTSIKVFREIRPLRQWRHQHLLNNRSVGLVPTMGALHEGHISLIRMAAAENAAVVVSMYVNPTQFGVHEDLDKYPQTYEADCLKLRDLDRELASDGGNMGSIAAVFVPTTTTMYPSGRPSQEADGDGSFVTITPLGNRLEGASRPVFFRGVATVCMKLFNIVRPDKVYFGQKDVQQTVVIKKMVKDFCMGMKVCIGDTVREPDGLAMSSRNVYLGQRRRLVATALYKALKEAERAYIQGGRTREVLLGTANRLIGLLLKEQLQLEPKDRVEFEVDYVSLADPENMEELDEVDESRGAILSGAVKMLPVTNANDGEDLGLSGGPAVRLIDNIILKPVTIS